MALTQAADMGFPDPQLAMSCTRSRVYPNYKTKDRMGNGSDYDRSLVARGSLTIWLSPDAIAPWNAKLSRRRAGQRKYSDLPAEAVLGSNWPIPIRR
ncbi:MAG: hypothetical protein ACJA0V_003711 [Planctomycetota bacterium]|jgi:hypothetical protein